MNFNRNIIFPKEMRYLEKWTEEGNRILFRKGDTVRKVNVSKGNACRIFREMEGNEILFEKGGNWNIVKRVRK